jgi:hypothetical protein
LPHLTFLHFCLMYRAQTKHKEMSVRVLAY